MWDVFILISVLCDVGVGRWDNMWVVFFWISVLCDVRVGRWWDDMWVVLIVGSITETHAAPDASLKTELSRGLRPRKYQKSRK